MTLGSKMDYRIELIGFKYAGNPFGIGDISLLEDIIGSRFNVAQVFQVAGIG